MVRLCHVRLSSVRFPASTSGAAGPRAVLEAPDIHRALTRIAHEILERTKGADDVVLLGIPTRGVHARRPASPSASREFEGRDVPVGSLDITMYRDDLRLQARPRRSATPRSAPSGIDGKVVVLVDDVLFSGRTDPRRPRRAQRPRPPRAPCSSPCWSTAATASCRSAPTTSARTSPPRSSSGSRSSLAGDRRRRDAVLTQKTRPAGRSPSEAAPAESAADLSRDDAHPDPGHRRGDGRRLANGPIKKLPALRGRTVVNLFFEDSTRTRISFEAAAKRLSADVINFSAKGSSVVQGRVASRTPR